MSVQQRTHTQFSQMMSRTCQETCIVRRRLDRQHYFTSRGTMSQLGSSCQNHPAALLEHRRKDLSCTHFVKISLPQRALVLTNPLQFPKSTNPPRSQLPKPPQLHKSSLLATYHSCRARQERTNETLFIPSPPLVLVSEMSLMSQRVLSC